MCFNLLQFTPFTLFTPTGLEVSERLSSVSSLVLRRSKNNPNLTPALSPNPPPLPSPAPNPNPNPTHTPTVPLTLAMMMFEMKRRLPNARHW